MIVVVLVGIPLLFFGVTVSRLASSSRARRFAALHLIGMPTEVIARSAAVELGAVAGLGLCLGIFAMNLALPALAGSGLLGLRWFPDETRPTALQVLLLAAGLPILVGRLEAVSVRRAVANSLSIRRGAPPSPSTMSLSVLVVSSGPLLAIVLTGWLMPDQPLATSIVTLLYVAAVALAVVGCLLALPWLVGRAGQRLADGFGGVTTTLAGRRLSHDSSSAARVSGSITLLLVTGILGLAVVNDLQSLTADTGQRTLEVLFPRSTTATELDGAITSVSPRGTALRLAPEEEANSGTGSTENVAVTTCAGFSALVGELRPRDGTRCRDGQLYRIGPPPNGTSGQQELYGVPAPVKARLRPLPSTPASAPSLVASVLAGTTLVVTESPRQWTSAAAGGFLVARMDSGTTDRFTAHVLRQAPLAMVNYDDVDITTLYRLPLVAGLVRSCIALGLIVALLTLLAGAADRGCERTRELASLLALGVSKGTLVRVEALAATMATAVAVLLGFAVGWLAGDAYLALGGHHTTFPAAAALTAIALGPSVLVVGALAPVLALGKTQAEDFRRP